MNTKEERTGTKEFERTRLAAVEAKEMGGPCGNDARTEGRQELRGTQESRDKIRTGPQVLMAISGVYIERPMSSTNRQSISKGPSIRRSSYEDVFT